MPWHVRHSQPLLCSNQEQTASGFGWATAGLGPSCSKSSSQRSTGSTVPMGLSATLPDHSTAPGAQAHGSPPRHPPRRRPTLALPPRSPRQDKAGQAWAWNFSWSVRPQFSRSAPRPSCNSRNSDVPTVTWTQSSVSTRSSFTSDPEAPDIIPKPARPGLRVLLLIILGSRALLASAAFTDDPLAETRSPSTPFLTRRKPR